MSKLNINDLPSEVLIKVFRFLDGSNLKNATLTCKLWNYFTESDCRWSLKLDVGNSGKPKPKKCIDTIKYCMMTNRNIGTIEISRFSSNDSKILQIFERHGPNVVKLILHEGRIDSITGFVKLLNLMPNLESAVIRYVNLDGVSDVPLDQVLPDLKKLKKLKMVNSDQRIIECIGKAKLTTIKIVKTDRPEHYSSLVGFLLSQDLLTSLSLSRSMLVEMGKVNVQIPFRLTQLAFSDEFMKTIDDDRLLRFVKSQAENLAELELAGCDIPRSIYECIFTSMTQLNTLCVSISDIPRDRNFYELLKENCSVRTIKFLDVTGDAQYFGNFLRKLPNIRSLFLPHIDRVSKNDFSAMAQNLNKLESVAIKTVRTDISVGYMQFCKLKTLHITQLLTRINWNEFTKIHSWLAELTVQSMLMESFLTSEDIDHITTNVELKSIRLGIGFEADERFFEIIRTKCTNLRVLDLHRYCISGGLRHNLDEIDFLQICDNFD